MGLIVEMLGGVDIGGAATIIVGLGGTSHFFV